MEPNVCRCRLPSVSRVASSASRSSGSAAPMSPLENNSWPRLWTETNVPGCRFSSVTRATSSASRNRGSAAARFPLACKNRPRLLMWMSVSGCRLPRRFRMRPLAVGIRKEKGDLARHLQRLAQQRLGGGEIALLLQQQAEVADTGERVLMPSAEGLAQPLQRLA
eukprot:scaffold35947_cov63-Phaeocystis_antarctica.AAC.3